MASVDADARISVGGPGNAFLLAQLGAHSARLYAHLVAEVDLSPPQAGVLRAVACDPGRSQQAIATQLGAPATRLVVLTDELERRGLMERRRNSEDRRHYALYLTVAGRRVLRSLGRVAGKHNALLLAALDEDERILLNGLLTRIAEQQDLAVGVHPGYGDPTGKPGPD